MKIQDQVKIIEKAFRCSIAKIWSGYDCDLEEVFHAENASKARMKAFRSWGAEEFRNFDFMFKIKVKRAPNSDLVENNLHPLSKHLYPEVVYKMLHAIGWQHQAIHSKDPYRNRYVCEHDEDFENLIPLGLAKKQRWLDTKFYYLTELGIDVIHSTRPIPRYILSELINTNA
jgi:hypothetical protein